MEGVGEQKFRREKTASFKDISDRRFSSAGFKEVKE